MTVLLLFWFVWLFILFFCLISLVRLPVPHWIKVARVGILVFLILRKSFQLFTVEYDISHGLVIYSPYYIEICSLYTHFVEVFIVENWFCCIFFLCLLRLSSNLILHSFKCGVSHWFEDVGLSSYFWSKFQLIMICVLLMYYWIWFVNIFWRFFHLCSLGI